MKSIGYMEEQDIHKSEIAIKQLTEAIALFLKGNFICSLTLAGPAEELFGGLSKARGMKTVIEESVDCLNVILKSFGNEGVSKPIRKSMYNEWNHAKNKTKHHGGEDDEVLSVNPCDEAYWMIKRAISNGKMLGIEVTNEQEFENWVIENCNL